MSRQVSKTSAAATAPRDRRACPARLDARPRQRQGQQADRAGTQQQQQQMPQPQPAAIRVVALLDEPQRRKLQMPRLLPHDQVQHDRHDRQRRAPPSNAGMCRNVHRRDLSTSARRLTRYSVSALSNCMLVSSAHVVDAALKAFAAIAFAERLHFAQIVGLKLLASTCSFSCDLGLFELDHAVEREIALRPRRGCETGSRRARRAAAGAAPESPARDRPADR